MTLFPVSDLHRLLQHKDPGHCMLLTPTHLHDFQNAIGALACIPQREIEPMHGRGIAFGDFGLALDAL